MGLTERLQRAWLSRGWLACGLLPVAACYGALLLLRRNAYRLGWRRPVRLPVPVVVVGNLVVGGAGKTPTVIAVVHALQRQGHVVGVVSRGYGRANSATLVVQPDTPVSDCGDEPLLLRLRTGVPVCVGRDRVAAGKALLQRHPEIDVIVSDDGLQHWRLARQAQILVFDERGAGNGWLLLVGRATRQPVGDGRPARTSAARGGWTGPAATLLRHAASARPHDRAVAACRSPRLHHPALARGHRRGGGDRKGRRQVAARTHGLDARLGGAARLLATCGRRGRAGSLAAC